MNADNFVAYLRRYGNIEPEAEADVRSRVRYLTRSKGQTIIRAGQIEASFFYIERGMVRAYYKHDTKQITIWLATDDQVAVSMAPQFQNQPAYETVECIEDCELICLSNRDWEELYRTHPCMNTIGRRMAEEFCCDMDARMFYLQVLSASERYEELRKWEPEVVKRAPLRFIASYLGISQETLSRIRSKDRFAEGARTASLKE